jgi:hypothetical protein
VPTKEPIRVDPSRKDRLERELTSKNGIINQLIPGPWHWKRVPDTIYKYKTGVGFDGLLLTPGVLFIVEAKIRNNPLKPNELDFLDDLLKKSYPCFLILRWFNDYEWTAELPLKYKDPILTDKGRLPEAICKVIDLLPVRNL